VTDWQAWHAFYDVPGSSLARRLDVVRRRVRESLAALAHRPAHLLSLCAGDGRDVLPELAAAGGPGHRCVLVERDEALAAAAGERARALALPEVTVVVGDAGALATFAEHLPVDLLLLCGIFGNVSEHDIRATINAVGSMLRPGGTVIWTRGGSAPDLRPSVRRWFVEAGYEEVAYDGEPERYGVGVGRLISPPPGPSELPARLFTFTR
jgi:ubiquinone/menaquinone biosynthesis C-methylase UbiE